MQVEFIKAKDVEAGRLTLWWRGQYLYELEVCKLGKTIWKQLLEDCDFDTAEEEFAQIN